jgi:type IV secretory pathway TrbF-like protein
MKTAKTILSLTIALFVCSGVAYQSINDKHPFVRCVEKLGDVTDINCDSCAHLLKEGEMPEYTDLGFYVVQQ